MPKKKIIILGSTGSIGESTINVILKNKKDFEFILLAASKNYKSIISQIKVLHPKYFVISNKKIYEKIKKKIKSKKTKIVNNFDVLKKISLVDFTISAIPGIEGLEPTINSVKKSKKLLIANKESIIYGWHLLKKDSKKYGTKVSSIDSEHFSIGTILNNFKDKTDIDTIYLTASGGPFLNYKKNELKEISPSDAIKHPRWKMGKKISVDSATLMNKILEIIEAQKIFSISFNKLKILIHPESLVHAIVKFNNGLTFFLYHEPDMKIPIANSIYGSSIKINKVVSKNIKNTKIKNLEFFEPKISKYKILETLNFIKKYPSAGILINSANEELVSMFLRGKIQYNSIISSILNLIKDKKFKKYAIHPANNLNQIYFLNDWTRNYIKSKFKKILK